MRRLTLAVAAALWPAGASAAGPAIVAAAITETAPPTAPDEPHQITVAWPFCPSTRTCGDANPPLWAEIRVRLEAYGERVRDPHDDVVAIANRSRADLEPLARALVTYLTQHGTDDEIARAAHAQGMVQSIQYALDDSTGWTEYPKFGLEMLVDQQGDCDDAATALGALLADLGIGAWYVLWRPKSGHEGHLSTAVTRSGKLANVQPPPGSSLVEAPDGTRLLHVDGVGTTTGCASGCGAIGMNLWPKQGLVVQSVTAVDSPTLAESLPISVWKQGDSNRPTRALSDRRHAVTPNILPTPPGQTHRPEAEAARLRGLGVTDEAVRSILRVRADQRRGAQDWVYYSLSGICALFLAGGAFSVWRARRRAAALPSKRRSLRR